MHDIKLTPNALFEWGVVIIFWTIIILGVILGLLLFSSGMEAVTARSVIVTPGAAVTATPLPF